MKKAVAAIIFLATAAFATGASPASWPAETPPLIRGALGYTAIPGAVAAPDKAHLYKVIYNATHLAAKPDQPVDAILFAATDISALRGQGVPANKTKFALIFHGPAVDAILNNAAYKAKYGIDNPNLALLDGLKKAGADILICGQYMIANKIDPAQLSPEITVGSEAFLVLMTYQNNGYAVLEF